MPANDNLQVDTVLGLQRKEAFASATFFGSTGLAGNITILALLGYGGTLVSRGVISVGDLTSLLLYSAYVGGSMGQLSSFFVSGLSVTSMGYLFSPDDTHEGSGCGYPYI